MYWLQAQSNITRKVIARSATPPPPPEAGVISKICKRIPKKIPKMFDCRLFLKKCKDRCFACLDSTYKLFDKFCGKCENCCWKGNRKIQFLTSVWKVVKIRPYENNIFFLQQIFQFRVGTFPSFPSGGSYACTCFFLLTVSVATNVHSWTSVWICGFWFEAF